MHMVFLLCSVALVRVLSVPLKSVPKHPWCDTATERKFEDYCYATLGSTDPVGTTLECQDEYVDMPEGWEISPDTTAIKNAVVKGFKWSTSCVSVIGASYNVFGQPCSCRGDSSCRQPYYTCDPHEYSKQGEGTACRVDSCNRQILIRRSTKYWISNYELVGNGWCLNGNNRVGMRANWRNTNVRSDNGAGECEELCDADASCIGYQTEDDVKCQLMPGRDWGLPYREIDGVDSERRNWCWEKISITRQLKLKQQFSPTPTPTPTPTTAPTPT